MTKYDFTKILEKHCNYDSCRNFFKVSRLTFSRIKIDLTKWSHAVFKIFFQSFVKSI